MDEKTYFPEVAEDNPFPNEESQSVIVQESSPKGNYTPATTKPTSFPTRKIAVELIGQALNTRSKKILQEFELQQSGGFKIGDYQSGESGDIRITPNGLTARNKAGLNTFVIDGDTGDAVFAGSIQSGSIITGLVTVGDNRIIIDGESKQIIVNDGEYDRVLIGYQKDGF
jgi:hypothetical protein